MVIKMTGLGFRAYFLDRFNTFDCAVVFISAIDVALSYSHISSKAGTGTLSALRGLQTSESIQIGQNLEVVLIFTSDSGEHL